MVGMTAIPGDDLDDDSTVIVLPGDTPLLRPETLDELVADPRRQRQRGHAAHLRARRPHRVRPGHPAPQTATAACCASSSNATRRPRARHQRGLHEHLRLPARPARPGAAPALPRQRPGRVLPHRRGRRARRHGSPHRRVQAPADETQGVNDRWQLALAERELRDRTNRRWLLNGVTMLDPRQTFIDVTVQLGRDVTLYPGHDPAGQHRDRRRLRDRPGHPPRRLRRRRRTASSRTPSAAMPRSATMRTSVRTPTCRPGLGCRGHRRRSVLHCTCRLT